LGKSDATQGGDLSAYYIASFENNQDFWDPEYDRGPSSNDIRHRFNAAFIYEVPGISGGQGLVNGVLGGWQISGVVQMRSGNALLITQPSGISRSRPDVVPGEDLILDDWKDTCSASGCNYLNTAGFARVPVSLTTNATLRPGTYNHEMARGPGRIDNNLTLAKSFGIGSGTRLQIRADIFNFLNVKNYDNPQTAINNPNFGRITGATSDGKRARVFQFGGRLTF
jgi:hypothetical protein